MCFVNATAAVVHKNGPVISILFRRHLVGCIGCEMKCSRKHKYDHISEALWPDVEIHRETRELDCENPFH